MKQILAAISMCSFLTPCYAQLAIKDESIRYQQERMVFKQWNKNKFTPTSGWLGINPYYWLTWGLHPNYKNTDRRPLSAWGPQTQRLGLVGTMNAIDDAYKLESDTLRNTALLEITNHSGLTSSFDPLWLLYYSKELKPVLEFSDGSILTPLPTEVRGKVISEGLYDWFKNELTILKERINAAHTTNMDRGARILTYHRLLQEYRQLQATWATRTASAQSNINMTRQQDKVTAADVPINGWTTQSDVEIAKEVVRTRKY